MVRAYFPQRVPKSIVSNSNNPPQGMEITGVPTGQGQALVQTGGLSALVQTGSLSALIQTGTGA